MDDHKHDTNPAGPSHSALRRSRKQLQAEEIAKEAQARVRWRTVVPLASTTWPRLSPDELKSSEGNVHRLAGLIQLRYQTTRAESDQQVATFMKEHVTPA